MSTKKPRALAMAAFLAAFLLAGCAHAPTTQTDAPAEPEDVIVRMRGTVIDRHEETWRVAPDAAPQKRYIATLVIGGEVVDLSLGDNRRAYLFICWPNAEVFVYGRIAGKRVSVIGVYPAQFFGLPDEPHTWSI